MSARFLIGLLIALNIASAVGVVMARHRHRQLFVELNRLEKVRDELNVEFSRLQLEQATWAESTLIDRTARERLGMVLPVADDIVVVRP
ncbi:cell division protein FtsL [Solilutibacter tolerans]|uniref:Cell division protein FtsL n=1 Tax=Solilutibacter tolerans TaxID=1604334 RepID=A0A1N6NCI9_9GAMM|nr:cell division protein FtsL [Lysobacter tolerans]SIP89697.1 cell division protein FtsL [Lysobacter tolerans]